MKHFLNGPRGLALGLLFSASVQAEELIDPPTQDSKISETQIKEQYQADRLGCNSISGNAKEVCIAEAKGREKVSKVEFIDRKKNSAKSRYDLLMTKAQVNFEVAEERCDEHNGNAKDICLEHAKAAIVAAKSDAETQILSSSALQKPDEKSTQAPYKMNAIEVSEVPAPPPN